MEPNGKEVVTIHCKLDGEHIQLSREAASRAEALRDMMEDTESNVLPVELAAPPVCLVAAMLKHDAAAAADTDGEATFSLDEVELEAMMSAMEAAHQLLAAEVFTALARGLFRRMEGLGVEALRQMLGVSAADAIPEADRASILAEPLFEPEGEAATSPEGGLSSSSTRTAAPPPLGHSMTALLGSEDAILAALEHAPTVLLRTLKTVSNAWKLRARRELCSRACPLATRPLNADGRPAPVPTRREDIQGIDAEFLIRAGRPWEVVAAGRVPAGLAKLHGYGFSVDIAAAQQVDLEAEEEDEEEDGEDLEEDALSAVLRLPALRACITPEEGEVPRELLLATIALAASGTVAGVPVQELREGSVDELDLDGCCVGPAGAQLVGMLLSANGAVTDVSLSNNNLTGGKYVQQNELSGSTFKAGDRVMHEGQEQTILKEKDSDGDVLLGSLDGVIALADALKVTGSALTKISVGGNYLGDTGAKVLCDALRESTVTKVQELDLSDNDIGPDGAKAVAAMAAVVASITSVR